MVTVLTLLTVLQAEPSLAAADKCQVAEQEDNQSGQASAGPGGSTGQNPDPEAKRNKACEKKSSQGSSDGKSASSDGKSASSGGQSKLKPAPKDKEQDLCQDMNGSGNPSTGAGSAGSNGSKQKVCCCPPGALASSDTDSSPN